MQVQQNFLVSLVRAIVPRFVRNAIRRPKATADRLRGKLRRGLGMTTKVEMTDKWCVTCHPMCQSEFSVFQHDQEQKAEMKIFIDHCTSGMQFVDVGTHWGAFTLSAIFHGGASSRVICIEASRQASDVLRDNLVLNGVADQAIIVNAACGAEVGEIEMLTTGAGGADYLVIPAEKRPDTVKVRQISVDASVAEHEFKPTHIKIDVEGYEREVIWGARNTLSECRPILFLELHGDLIRQRKQDPLEVLNELNTLGYREILSVYGKPVSIEDLEKEGFKARIVLLPSK